MFWRMIRPWAQYVDPAGFDGSSAGYHEDDMPGAAGVRRMVNRNDRAVAATVVNGTLVYENGDFAPGFGTSLRAGRHSAQTMRSSRPP